MQRNQDYMYLVHEVHVWFDTQEKIWLITAFDSENNQVFDSDFAHSKADAMLFAKRDYPDTEIVPFTRSGHAQKRRTIN